MIVLYLRILLVVLFCAVAAYTDKKTGYIYDWITYPLIGLGLLLNIFTFSFTQNMSIVTIGGVIFIIGFLIYYLGKLGGGDVKLFLGIHFILPYINNQLFILWVLVFSCFLAVIFISIKYMFVILKKVKFTKKLLVSKISSIITNFCLFFGFVTFIYFSVNHSNLSSWFYLTIVPIMLGLFINVFQDEIKKHIYLLWKPVKDLEDGDVLAKEYLTKTLITKLNPILKNKNVIEEKDIELMKKKKITLEIPIYYYLPKFGPYILLGVIVSIPVLFLLF
jgi:Flp pilus assembly protein protease CpaA